MPTIRNLLEKLESSQVSDKEFASYCYEGFSQEEKERETQKGFKVYQGKVRELIKAGDELWIYHSDRLTAFDRYVGLVPFKGAILAKISEFWLEKASSIIPTHMKHCPHDRVIAAEAMTPIKVEVVVRGYMAGSMARAYNKGEREFCGVVLPEGLKEFHKLPENIITPTTKAAVFEHDEEASAKELIASGVCTKEQWEKISQMAFSLFELGQKVYLEKGWILVDTKYEFGLSQDGSIKVIDEVHTPDSSRLWEEKSYLQALSSNNAPKMLDKENVRRYLISQGFSGEGEVPVVPRADLVALAKIYLDVAEGLIGKELLWDKEARLPYP